MLADQVTETWQPSNEAERVAIREQLEKLLLTSHFSASRRYPSFLRFVLQHTLAGESELLKERTLGIELFGRAPDYDTAADPIVRVTAAEIRKRIEQYYQEPGRAGELRFSLPSGSYIPLFSTPSEAAPLSAVPSPAVAPEVQIQSQAKKSHRPFLIVAAA